MPRANANKKYFCKLDLVKGYWQIPFSDESKSKTVFSTKSGLYRFHYVAFGIKAAPAVFARLMQQIIQGIPGVEHNYDDMLIASAIWEGPILSLRHLFARIETGGLTVRPSKCKFGME